MGITVCVLGNIGAGKSSVAMMLRERLNGFALLCMDEYRRKYNLYTTIQGENTAFEVFMKDIIALDYTIIETSGASKNFDKILSAIERKGGSVFKIYLYAPKNILLGRVKNRDAGGYKRPPFPYNMTIEKSMDFIAKAWTDLKADVRIDTNKLPLLAITNYIMSFEVVREAYRNNLKAKAANAWFYERTNSGIELGHRQHPEGTILIEVAIRLLRNGQNGGEAFTILMCKKDGSLRKMTNVVRSSKQMHYDVDTKLAYPVMNNDEFVGTQRNDWRDIFLYSLDEKKTMRLVTSRLMFLNGLRVWH
jgi:shikimate kinase